MDSKTKIKNARRVGLALGSGSARGWAHIGVIEALEELGVEVGVIAGTSIGALVGAFYASRKLDHLKSLALKLDWREMLSFMDLVLPRAGLIDGHKVEGFISQRVGERNIEDLTMPFMCAATDLVTSSEVVLGSGNLIKAVRASISVPGMFTPVSMDGMVLVDGGLVNPVPVSLARRMGADYIIAVDLNHDAAMHRRQITSPAPKHGAGDEAKSSGLWEFLNRDITELDMDMFSQFENWFADDGSPNIFDVMMKSLDILEAQVTQTMMELHPPELLIRPKLGHIRLMEFDNAQEAIKAGYDETMSAVRNALQT